MRIASITPHPLRIPLTKPFVISNYTKTHYEGVLVEIRTDDGTAGWGEGSPSHRVTGETQESVKRDVEAAARSLAGRPVEELEPLLADLWKVCGERRTAVAAVETALCDLRGKLFNAPYRRILGGDKEEIPTAMTVVIGSIEESVKEAVKLVEGSASILKIKVGRDPEEDARRVAAIRDAVGDKIRLWTDGNQGYTPGRARKAAEAFRKAGVEFLEQPMPANDLAGSAEAQKLTELPFMLDESVKSPRDLLKAVEMQAGRMVNIKVMKVGGIHAAAKCAAVAEAAGWGVMVGCNIETRIGISAGAQVALGLRAVRYADLDGHLFLKRQPVEGGVEVVRGVLRPVHGPGLGVAMRG